MPLALAASISCVPAPDAQAIGVRVEEADLLALAGKKRDKAALVLGECHLAIPEDDVLDEPAILLDGVQRRQEGQQPKSMARTPRRWPRRRRCRPGAA